MDRTLKIDCHGARIIFAMKKEDFREKIVKNVATSKLFARVICFGIDDLNDDEICNLIDLIRKNGVDTDISKSELPTVINAIAKRASSYQ